MALTDNLLAWWNMDETAGVTITDNTGNGYDGTLTGASPTSGGVEYFATSDYMLVDGSLDVDGSANLSIAGWFYIDTTGTGASERLLCMHNDGANEKRTQLMVSGTTLTYRQEDDAGTNQDVTKTGLVTGTNYFVVITWEPSTGSQKIYLNGSSSPSTATITAPTGSPAAQFIFGHSTANSYGQLDGKTWSWGIWNKILSPTEIDELYNSGTALKYADISGGAAEEDDTLFYGANF